MNVLIALSKNDEQINNVLNGYAYALNAVGVNIFQWGGGTPLFEVMDTYKPSLIVLSADSINKTVQKACKEFNPEVWVLFRYKDELKNKIEGAKEIGVLSEGETEVGQYFELFGADLVNYGPHRHNKKYEARISYVGRYNKQIDELLYKEPDTRIYSPDVWNTPAYVGTDNNKPAIYASSAVVVLLGTDVGPDQDTDYFNAKYSRPQSKNGPTLTGTHSYFHRIYDLLTQMGGHDELKIALEQKMKEVEDLYEKNRTVPE